jgi:hypothetical protein
VSLGSALSATVVAGRVPMTEETEGKKKKKKSKKKQ